MHHQWHSQIKYSFYPSLREEKVRRSSLLCIIKTRSEDSCQRRVYIDRIEGNKFIRRTKSENFPCKSHLLKQRHPFPWRYRQCCRCSRCWVHSQISNLRTSKRKNHHNANPCSQVRRICRLDYCPQSWSNHSQRTFQRYLQYSLISRSLPGGFEETAHCIKHRRRSQDQSRPKKDKRYDRHYQVKEVNDEEHQQILCREGYWRVDHSWGS